MENLTIENIVLMVLGVAIASLTAIAKFLKANKKKHFSAAIFFEENIIPLFLSLCSGLASLMLTDVVFHVLGVTEIPPVLKLAHAFLSGLVPQFFIDRIKTFFIK